MDLGNMIERAARALYEADFRDEMDKDYFAENGTYKDYVHAVLQAIREPSEAMADAGGNYLSDVTDAGMLAELIASDVWRDMIDAILAEG